MLKSEQLKIRLDEIGAPPDVKALAEALSDQALCDPLTGLYNRRFFDEALAQQTAAARRYDRDLSLILFDLDGLKQINDRQGHADGDAALQAFAENLLQTARKADIVCRIGGDEFSVLLPETSFAGARRFIERLPGAPAASAGLAALPAENLFAAADFCLLESKKEKNTLS